MADVSPPARPRRLASGLPDPIHGAVLGRFELRRILGQGAQSVVWLAFDPRLAREVAIKLMKAWRWCQPGGFQRHSQPGAGLGAAGAYA